MNQGGVKTFQFHYGTIKSFARPSSGALVICFNSTMVRLKAQVSPVLSSSFLFQFHYGTIKSPNRTE